MARTEEQWAHHEIDLHLASLADATIPAKATMSCVGYPLTSQHQSDRIMAAQWAVLSAVLGAGRLPCAATEAPGLSLPRRSEFDKTSADLFEGECIHVGESVLGATRTKICT